MHKISTTNGTAPLAEDPDRLRAELRRTAGAAAMAALTPLVPSLLACGIGPDDIGELARWLYVMEARDRQVSNGRRVSVSRIAAATGLSRTDVRRILNDAKTGVPKLSQRHAERVHAAWLNEPSYLLASGEPCEIPFHGAAPSFTALATVFASAVTPRALLEEMLFRGMIRETSAEHYLPVAFPPHNSAREVVQAAADHHRALSVSLAGSGAANQNFNRIVAASVPVSAESRAIREISRRCRTFAIAMERYLLDLAEQRSSSDSAADREVGVLLASFSRPEGDKHD